MGVRTRQPFWQRKVSYYVLKHLPLLEWWIYQRKIINNHPFIRSVLASLCESGRHLEDTALVPDLYKVRCFQYQSLSLSLSLSMGNVVRRHIEDTSLIRSVQGSLSMFSISLSLSLFMGKWSDATLIFMVPRPSMQCCWITASNESILKSSEIWIFSHSFCLSHPSHYIWFIKYPSGVLFKNLLIETNEGAKSPGWNVLQTVMFQDVYKHKDLKEKRWS